MYYSNNGTNEQNNVTSQQIISPQLQPGYVSIPISQIQAAAAAGTAALPPENLLSDNRWANTNTPPPNYDKVAELGDNSQEENGSRYQRFQ